MFMRKAPEQDIYLSEADVKSLPYLTELETLLKALPYCAQRVITMRIQGFSHMRLQKRSTRTKQKSLLLFMITLTC